MDQNERNMYVTNILELPNKLPQDLTEEQKQIEMKKRLLEYYIYQQNGKILNPEIVKGTLLENAVNLCRMTLDVINEPDQEKNAYYHQLEQLRLDGVERPLVFIKKTEELPRAYYEDKIVLPELKKEEKDKVISLYNNKTTPASGYNAEEIENRNKKSYNKNIKGEVKRKTNLKAA